MKKLRIGFIGNFQVPYTTENDRKWSFEKLGHEVMTFQENQTTAEQLTNPITMKYLDLLIYSHTHGWEIPNLIKVFQAYKEAGVPTASVHLDRWAWLKRAEDIGKEATWFTQYQFMADFSPEAEELYKKHHLNAYYLLPGVLEKECYMADPDYARFPHEIIFVGSKGYHPEYPFRPKMIDFLRFTYGKRFGHYGNDGAGVVRGADLNTLYATAKIAVGDSCFGGRPNYVSDRYFETRGRGGFLLHPLTDGVDNIGIGNYGGLHHDQPNLESLKKKIDYYLEHSFEREEMRKMGHYYVRDHGNYTVRARQMLEFIFPNT